MIKNTPQKSESNAKDACDLAQILVPQPEGEPREKNDDASPSSPPQLRDLKQTEVLPAFMNALQILRTLGKTDESVSNVCRVCSEKLLLASRLAAGDEPASQPRWRISGMPAIKPDPAERKMRINEVLLSAFMNAKRAAIFLKSRSQQEVSCARAVMKFIAHLRTNPTLLQAITPGSLSADSRTSNLQIS